MSTLGFKAMVDPLFGLCAFSLAFNDQYKSNFNPKKVSVSYSNTHNILLQTGGKKSFWFSSIQFPKFVCTNSL